MHNNKSSIVLVILAIAGVVRGYSALNSQNIAIDGLVYIRQAQMLAAGNFESALSIPFPPGYSALVAAVGTFLGLNTTPQGWEFAGVLASFICGLFLILVLYLLTFEVARGVEEKKLAAIAAASICAIHPQMVRYTTQVRSEGMYYLFFALSIFFVIRTLKTGKLRYALLTSVSSAVAYLVRPEGILVVGILVTAVLIWRGFSIKRRILLVVTSLSSFFILSVPYLLSIYGVGGVHHPPSTLKLTLKRHPVKIFESQVSQEDYVFEDGVIEEKRYVEKEKLIAYIGGFLRRAAEALLLLPRVLHPIALLLLLMWVFLRNKEREEWLMVTVALLYFLLMCSFEVGHRHLTQILIPFLPLSGIGVIRGLHYTSRPRLLSSKTFRVVFAIITVLMFLAPSLKPRHIEQAAEKRAGIWLRRYGTPHPRLLCRIKRVVYYAEGEHIGDAQYSTKGALSLDKDSIKKAIESRLCDYVVVDVAPLSDEERKELNNTDSLLFVGDFKNPPLSLDTQEVKVYRVMER
ncbi:MAG: glycosyltransferase family 39 protein [Planctomycetota bacterium]|nr:glycosyltransferase family 39 protein [Planctomycetota bacterium]